MAVFKATENKKGSLDSGKFKATNRKSYDSTMVYDWETKNKESISTLNNYYTKINNGEFLTADDITAYRSALDNYISSSNSLRGINKSFGGTYSEEEEKNWTDSVSLMQTDYDNASKFYSSFKNEDKYKDYLAGVKRREEQKTFDLVAGKAEIEDLQVKAETKKSLEKQINTLNAQLNQAASVRDTAKVTELNTQLSELRKQYAEYGDTDYNALLAEKRAYYGEAERLQNSTKLTDEAKNSEDFDIYAQQGANIKNPTLDEAWGGFSIGSWRPFGEDVGNIVTFSREYADEELAGIEGNNSPRLTNDLYGFMTEEEVSIYNYYLAKEGKEKASEYLSAIEGDLTARQASGMVDNIGDNGFLKVAFGFAAGIDQFASGVKNLITDKDYYSSSASQMASAEIRESFDTGFGQVVYDLANTTGNMLPSILVGSVFGGGVGNIAMGLSAMGNAKAEMINLGYTKDQATAYGVLVGASEAGLQYLLGGISALGGKASGGLIEKVLTNVDNAFARTAIKLGGSMLSEGFEESLQTILEPWFKSIVTGVDFEAADASEVLYSGLLGALSAGLLEGAGTIGGEVSTYKSGKLVQNVGAVDRLTKLGSTFAADSVAYKLASKVDENTGAYTIGRLLNEVDATLTEQNKSEIVKSLVRKGMSTEDANIQVKWLNEVVEGAELTDAQALLLDSNDVLSRTFHDVIINENSTVNQRNKAYAEAVDMVNKGVPDTKATNGSKTIETPKTEIPSTESETKVEGEKADLSKAKTTYEGNEVSIKEVSSIKDGEVFVRLNDGREVNAKEVDFNRTEDGLIYEHVANMNEQTAQYFIEGFNKGNIGGGKTISFEEYMRGFDEAYKNGSLGIPYYALSKDGFASTLSETQRKIAYNRGRIDSVAKVEAKQSKLEEERASVSKTEKAEKKKGKVYFEKGVYAKNNRQKTSIKALQVLADALGVDIHIFESATDANGKRSGKNGWFDPSDNSIHIDLYAGADGKSTILFTAAHELTHFIREWSPKKFKTFADFLLAQYGARGISVEQLVQSQIDKAKRNGRDIDFDTAYEEVIADACESMLTDSNAIKKLAMLKAKDRGLVNKIKTFIDNLVEKIKKAYAKLAPDSVEGQLVRGMVDVAKQLQDLWTDALVDAGETYQTIDKNLSNNGVMVDPKTESASLLSVRDVLDSKQQDQVAKALAERFGVTEEEAKNWISAETSLASIILNPKYSQYLDYTADPNEQAIKKNSDYPQGTVDFSNICKKRRDFTDVMNRVLRKFPNHVFEATDLAKIRTIMMEEGMEVACGICYVEDRRQLDSIVAQDFINSLALYREGSKTRPDGAPFNTNQLKALQLIDGDTYTPTIYELVSLEGRNSLKAKNPAMEEAWVKFNNARGMQSVRLLLNDAEYKRQILKYSPTVVNRKNDYGGLRIYSFSDMEMFHLIDIIQVITDSATVGLSIQGYTKVNEYAKAVKDTGEKLNRSLIPKGDLGYHMENGKIVLDYDTVEGIDINHPDFFDSTDNPNVGNIVIGINETQIKASMLSDFIDYIIPFHTGQSKDVLGEKGIAEWHNYEDSQSERDLATGKKSSHQINIYTEVLQAAEKEGKPITNKVEFVNKFLEVCKENGLQPRFSEFLNIGKDGEYVYTEGYHKFLVDFKMFDTKTGEYLPQKPVKPIFDNEYLMSLLKDYVKSQQEKDAKLAETIPTVLDRITNEIVKPDVKYSDRDSATFNGKPFWSGSVSLIDGVIEEVHSIEEAEDVDFHHSMYFSQAQVEKMQNGENAFFWVDNGVVNGEWRDSIPKNIIDKIKAQIELKETKYSDGNPDIRYSDRDYELAEQREKINKVLASENAKLKEDNQYLKELLKLQRKQTHGAKFTKSSVQVVASKLMKSVNASGNKSELVNLLNNFYEHIAESKHLAWEEIAEKAQPAVKWLKEHVVNKADYEYAEAMVEQDILLQVYDGYWDVSTLHTAADSYQKQINLLKHKHHKKIAELREYHNEKHNQLKKEYQDKIARIKSEYRERNAKTTRELMTRYQESRAKAAEGRHKTEMRHKIKKVVNELNKLLLRPTKDKHVKEELQRAVAEALWAINMDTVVADDRVAKYNDLIAKATDPDVIQELTDTRDRIQFQGENLKDKLDALKSSYEKIKNSKDVELSNAYQEVVLNSINNTLELVGDTPIRYMSLEQLEAVYEMYKMVLHTVRTANKMFKESKYETLVKTAEAVNAEVRLAGGEHYKRTVIGSTLAKIGWTFLKPFTAFRTIGSKTLTGLYNNLRLGEDTYYVDIKEAQDFIKSQYEKHNFSKWDMKQTKEFTAKSGKTFSLTLEQMMSIFAYSRREQAKAHLLEGGIVLDDAVTVTEKNKLGLPVKYEVTTKNAFNLSEGTLLEIIDSLTDEQKAFVKEMQSYLSDVMGAKGNEISMEMYGIKLFKEVFYFPIKSSKDYMGFKPEEAGEIKLKNPSFSKETVKHANNPVVLSNFTDVWANHVNDMAMYHSFVLPLEDFTRVFNYKTRTDAKTETMSTEATIANAYGKGATDYIRNFLRSLNGGVRVQGTPVDKLITLTKKGAVLASASVVIQQPSAVMRAMAYINPKYFVKATPQSLNLKNHKKDWEEIKKYAPIAGIKEMGHFDIGLGQSTVDWIKSNQTTMEKVDDALSKAPAYMDEITWVSIWQAVKREVLETTDLKFGTEAFLNKVGERFTEVVSLSQVYDSVFARSDIMRNANPLAKMLTSFMAEPSTTLNMLFDSWLQGKRTGNKKVLATTSGAVVASVVLNSMLKSVIIAMRDDDEDESYIEKYFGAFAGDLIDSLNPLTLIPVVKDIVSIFQGYDVERMDMALFSDLKNAIDAFDSDNKTDYEKWSGLVGAISAFFGIPIKNVERDIRGLYNTIRSFFKGEKTTGAGIWNSIKEGLSGKEISKTQQLYEAYLNGDQEQIKRVEGRFKDQTDIEAALRKALRENDPRIREAAQAVIDGNHEERIRITKEIKAEGHFKQDIIVAAINAELTALRREMSEAKNKN